MRKIFIATSLAFFLLMLSCSSESTSDQLVKAELRIQELEEKLDESIPSVQQNTSIINAALDVAELLKNNDYKTLSSQYVDDNEGLTFSPVPYIDLENDRNFSVVEVANLLSNTTVYTWTKRTPSGHPVEGTFKEYTMRYVNDHDYTIPHMIGNNRIIGEGSMISNISDAYPSSEFVTLHFTGFDTTYEGMDWTSLILIFKQIDGQWKLVNINHAHWTP